MQRLGFWGRGVSFGKPPLLFLRGLGWVGGRVFLFLPVVVWGFGVVDAGFGPGEGLLEVAVVVANG